MAPFTGRTIVITGASSGIGRALASALSPQRPNLVLSGRNETRLEAAVKACQAAGAAAVAAPADVASEPDCRRLIETAAGRFGGIDVLVLNAGITMWSTFEEVQNLRLYGDLMAVNYLGAVYPTYYALPHLKRAGGRGGQIVAVSSLAGLTGVPTRTGYAATKHAMVGFFESLRIELRGTGVSVTIVAPDFVVTDIHRRAIGPDGRPLGETPLQESRILTADACASMIVKAMERRRRLVITSARGRAGRWVKLVAPGLIDAVAARAIRKRH
jgi:short-subunit dehydrogenase